LLFTFALLVCTNVVAFDPERPTVLVEFRPLSPTKTSVLLLHPQFATSFAVFEFALVWLVTLLVASPDLTVTSPHKLSLALFPPVLLLTVVLLFTVAVFVCVTVVVFDCCTAAVLSESRPLPVTWIVVVPAANAGATELSKTAPVAIAVAIFFVYVMY